MNEYQTARTTLFRAMLGEEPRPTAEEVEQVKAFLHESPEFHAGLDELADIVVLEKTITTAAWRTQLQAYVAAQLAGDTLSLEFDQLRQQLDASVELSEEYALLYETMEREAQGLLPVAVDIPPLNLDFLPAKVETEILPQTTPTRWWTKLVPVNLPWPISAPWPGHARLAWVASAIALFLLLLGVGLGLWDVTRPSSPALAVTPTAMESQPQPSAFFRLQMQLETSAPATSPVSSSEMAPELKQCTQIRQVSFARTLCKI